MAMQITKRIRDALLAFKGGTRSEYISTIVRPSEIHSQGMFQRYDYFEMLKRYNGWFKVATSRNGAAVASLKFTLCRNGNRGKTGFRTRPASKILTKQLREGRVGRLALKAAMRSGENVEEIDDPNHPIIRLLDNPNPFMGYYELAEITEIMQGVCGDIGWYMVAGENGWPVEAWPMYPQYTRVVADEKNIIKEYIYGRGREIEQHFPEASVLFFKRPNPFGDPYRGMSDLYACASSVDLSTMFDSYALNSLKNAVQPGLIISDESLTPARQKEIYTELHRRSSTLHAARDLLLQLSKDAKIMPWEPKATEAGFLGGASDRATMEKIAAACDIPPDILVMGPTSLAHGETAMPHWMRYGVRPRAIRFENVLNRNLPDMFKGLGDDLFIVIEDPVSADETTASADLVAEVGAGIRTVNEARVARDLPPTDNPEDDELRDPQAMEQAKLDATVDMAEKDRKAAKDKPEAVTKTREDVHIHIANGEVHTKAITPPEHGKEPPEVKAIGKIVLTWLTGIVDDASRQLPDHPAIVEAYSFVTGTDKMKLAEKMNAPLEAGVQVGIDEGIAELPEAARAFVVEKSRVQQYVDEVNGQLVESLSKTIDDQIKAVLVKELEKGTTGPELTAAVKAVLKERTLADAERLAVTEASQVLHGGAIIAWQKSGVVSGKKWLLSGDPCPVCEAIARDHSTAPLDSPFVPFGATIKTADGTFTASYRAIMHPPAHPRCRCDMVPILIK